MIQQNANVSPLTRHLRWVWLLPMLALWACNDSPTEPDSSETDMERYLSGGETTVFNATSGAFSFPAANISDLDKHLDGDLAFEAAFVKAPAPVNSGLGPIFNNNACESCHPSDGRGQPPQFGQPLESMLIRISVPGSDPVTGGPRPVPGFGGQLNDKAVFGVPPEAEVMVTYTETAHTFADGEPYTLRKPEITLVNPYSDLPGDVLLSPRVALPVFGRGLLEAIPEATILALADEADADGDGISGRPNYVYDFTAEATVLGRFGWKANAPTSLQQTAGAYHDDMGVTNPIFQRENSFGQQQADTLADDPEIDSETLDVATFYIQTLAVPARRDIDDPQIARGEQLFRDAQCSACHTPTLETGVLPGVPEVSNQKIQPFTDMLLHDMGEGLADGRPDYRADGGEWRTPPLWGIGLTRVVNDHTFFLHDGRARNLIEAIMWHGGEAEDSRDFVNNMLKEDREALIAFLQSL